MSNFRRTRHFAPILVAALLVMAATAPVEGRVVSGEPKLTADLDGKPIELVEVGNWYCHDFDYPAIHCFSNSKDVMASPQVALAAADVNYVIVYEFTTFQGGFMYMSQNYSILGLIGWSDRISSFQVTNSMSGAFWTDWLYTGTRYNFCCNQSVGSLGSFNDTFSSVFHN